MPTKQPPPPFGTKKLRQGKPSDAINTYPILTSPFLDGTSAGAGGSAPGGLTRTVEQAIRDTLGWRPRPDDPAGFKAALATSFTITEFQGRTDVRHVPRALVTSIRGDLGAVTGAQASLALRGKAAVEASLPILDRLTPLRADADKEDAAAAKSLIRATLLDLAGELGNPVGPRKQKVDALFARLGDGNEPADSPELLARLRDVYGMRRGRVNTIAEEEDLTSWYLIRDYANDLNNAWASFVRDYVAWFGPVLQRASRLLGVIAEQVDEVEALVGSVFLTAEERTIIEVERDLDLAGLLDWIRAFASKEAPSLLQDAGKSAAETLRPTAQELARLVAVTLYLIDSDYGDFKARVGRIGFAGTTWFYARAYRGLPAGMRTERVARSIDDLFNYLALLHDGLLSVTSPKACQPPCTEDPEIHEDDDLDARDAWVWDWGMGGGFKLTTELSNSSRSRASGNGQRPSGRRPGRRRRSGGRSAPASTVGPPPAGPPPGPMGGSPWPGWTPPVPTPLGSAGPPSGVSLSGGLPSGGSTPPGSTPPGSGASPPPGSTPAGSTAASPAGSLTASATKLTTKAASIRKAPTAPAVPVPAARAPKQATNKTPPPKRVSGRK